MSHSKPSALARQYDKLICETYRTLFTKRNQQWTLFMTLKKTRSTKKAKNAGKDKEKDSRH